MKFVYPWMLALVALVPVAGVFWLWLRARAEKRLEGLVPASLRGRLLPNRSDWFKVQAPLMLVGLVLIVFAAARPQWGHSEQKFQARTRNVVVALDVSRSMLASSTDDAKGISRLDRAKFLFNKLINSLENDKVGLVVFAGNSSLQLPITNDFVSAKIYINDLSTSMINEQGTDIGAAIDMALQGFSSDEDVNRAIILLTDAEDHEEQAVAVADKARQAGVQVNVIGVGTAKGALIPIGNGSSEFLKDETGTPVTTRFNADAARKIAESGSGNYINGNDADADQQMVKLLDKIDKADLGSVKYKASAERFYIFLWIAFALIIADIFILDRKIGWLSKINFFSKPVK